MHRLVVAAIGLALAACGGVEVDDRPATLEYVTQAILVPSCATAQCHSSFRRAEGLSLSTVDEARASLAGYVVPGDPESSLLYLVLVSDGGDDPEDIPRMPYDQPMADADVELIRRWIERGAPGL